MRQFLLFTAAATLLATTQLAADHPLVPRLVGEWWTIAGDPDLGPLTTPGQWYMAALLPSLKGIQVTRMEWVPAR